MKYFRILHVRWRMWNVVPVFFAIFAFTTSFANAKIIPSSHVANLSETFIDDERISKLAAKQFDYMETSTQSLPALQDPQDITIGECLWAIGRRCPDKDLEFRLYTRKSFKEGQTIEITDDGRDSNLTDSFFDPQHPSKIIIHGYNADMFMHALQSIKREYLKVREYNIFYIDWSKLAKGLCYLNSVHNVAHSGKCVAQLVRAIVAQGNEDVHVIGFSLGAQMTNFIAQNLGSYRLPRITGLDPALPLFITSGNHEKLDASDATYVDVMHTNALIQGKFEQCGDSDVYMNGGILQPSCFDANHLNPFQCFHHRAIEYFVESIRSSVGFWAWPCNSYVKYLFGICPSSSQLVEVGANIQPTTKGMYFVNTRGSAPYALGKARHS